MSYVSEVPAASPEVTASHFLRRLSVETDCADVHHALNTRSKILCCYMWWAARRPSPGAIFPARSICRIRK
jgi:hypothetical protein